MYFVKREKAGGQIRSRQSKKIQKDEIARFHPDPDKGLSQQQIQSRIHDGMINHTENDSSKWLGKII